jgi:hypothetical protein
MICYPPASEHHEAFKRRRLRSCAFNEAPTCAASRLERLTRRLAGANSLVGDGSAHLPDQTTDKSRDGSKDMRGKSDPALWPATYRAEAASDANRRSGAKALKERTRCGAIAASFCAGFTLALSGLRQPSWSISRCGRELARVIATVSIGSSANF